MPRNEREVTARVSQDRKKIAGEFFRFIDQGKPKEGLRFFAPQCKQHNTCIHGGMEALLDAMSVVQKEGTPKYTDPFCCQTHLS